MKKLIIVTALFCSVKGFAQTQATPVMANTSKGNTVRANTDRKATQPKLAAVEVGTKQNTTTPSKVVDKPKLAATKSREEIIKPKE